MKKNFCQCYQRSSQIQIDETNKNNNNMKNKIQKPIQFITKTEYNVLLDLVQKPELGKQWSGGRIVNIYRSWLKDAIELGMETGLRSREIVLLKWSDITEENNIPVFIEVGRDEKRMRGRRKLRFVPITTSLMSLLHRMGFFENRFSEKYILANEENIQRSNVERLMVRAFSHYCKQLPVGSKLRYRCLRRTYLTQGIPEGFHPFYE